MLLALPEQRIIQTVSLPEQGNRAICSARRSVGPWLGGNKVYKLRENLMAFRRSGKRPCLHSAGLVEPSGCYCGTLPPRRNSRCWDRPGEENWNPRLDFLRSAGMRLVSPSANNIGAKKTKASQTFYCQAAAREPDCSPSDFQVVPEGGSNEAGFWGSKRILDPAISSTFTHVVVACGTGTTLAGPRHPCYRINRPSGSRWCMI